MSGAFVLAVAGVMTTLGHDGLAVLLGLSGGLLIAGTLIVPHMRRSGMQGPLHLVGARFGLTARVAATLVVITAITVIIAAELEAVALTLALVTGTDLPRAMALAGLVALLFAMIATAANSARIQALAFAVMAAALALPVVVHVLTAGGMALPQLTFGALLQSISSVELRLLEAELADPVTMRPYLRPFTSQTPVAGALLTLTLAIGLATLPSLLMKPSLASTAARARLGVAVAGVLLMLAALAFAPVAASTRLALLERLAGSDPASLAPWITDLGRLGLLRICGVDAVTVESVAAACAALPDPPTVLRLYDIDLTPHAALLALPGLIGLPAAVTYTIAVAVMFAAITAIVSQATALRHQVTSTASGHVTSTASGVASRIAVVLVVAIATLWASTRPADLMTMLAWGLSLLAAGLAPVLVASIWWSRTTPAGAVAAIVTGVAITGYYIVATRYFAVSFYETWAMLSNAGEIAILDFEAARDVVAAAESAEDRALALAALDAEARRIANWWGIRPAASGILGAAAGTFVLVVVSALTPRTSAAQSAVLARIRGGQGSARSHVRRWSWRRGNSRT